MPESKDTNFEDVVRQMTEILEKALTRINEVEQHMAKDLESIRRQLDAVGVLKDNIANLNNRIDSLSKKLSELSKSEPQELSRLMLRAISELDKRMQMFTVSEVLSRLESGHSYLPRSIVSTTVQPSVTGDTAKKASKTDTAAVQVSEPTSATATSKPQSDAVSEAHGTDQPWRERMREKYGLKKKPGKV